MILEMINAFSAYMHKTGESYDGNCCKCFIIFSHKLDPFVGLVVEYDRDWREILNVLLFASHL